ncbi:hypothetical protein Ga0102493_112418 [Erythrobacter litoralis]|jgi:hypothetical protein|uniref:Uncharacterized protein n=1 Tax=Erythrobacter litoralis TaxID=39960 RepID=A0A074MKM5_9SPHN|nr:hypothetical protein [Erythrobacter litoralis]AOL23433.1 hypothetical protein Ga0102493_112418 [Erythrobacter litoralis]KEO92423.1 hypothetical protein EH32_14275 [Erythrobacter litoralis]MEE4339414.1 hypothetical protein [Erythrobacter sp.]
MNGGTLAFALGGIICFFIGAYLSATEQLYLGIFFMGVGLVFQVASLARIKAEKKRAAQAASERDGDNAGR